MIRTNWCGQVAVPEGEPQTGLVAQTRRQPVGPADDENEGRPLSRQPRNLLGQRGAGQALAAFVEDDGDGLVGESGSQARSIPQACASRGSRARGFP